MDNLTKLIYEQILEAIREDTQSKDHPAVIKFASMAHEAWRNSLPEDQKNKPRIRSKNGGPEADINVPFNKLHTSAQEENLQAGRAALRACQLHPNDDEAAAEHIHNEWMKRNPKADWNASLHVPFNKLSKEEADKDRDHVTIMRNLLSNKSGTVDSVNEANNSQSEIDKMLDDHKDEHLFSTAAHWSHVEAAKRSQATYRDAHMNVSKLLKKHMETHKKFINKLRDMQEDGVPMNDSARQESQRLLNASHQARMNIPDNLAERAKKYHDGPFAARAAASHMDE